VEATITSGRDNPGGCTGLVKAPDRATPMLNVLRATSWSRGWTGVDAALMATSGGLKDHPSTPRYNLGMLVGAPVVATWHCDGSVQRRLQTPGHIHIVPPGFTPSWEDDRPTQYLGISLTPSLMRLAADEMGVNLDCFSLPPQMELRDEKIEHIAFAIKAELEEEDPNDRIYAEGLGLALAAQLLRRYGRTYSNKAMRGLTHRQVQSVVDFILGNLTKNLSLPEVASVTGISSSHFSVLFKQSIGLPVHKYVVKCRVEHAVELLSKGTVNLSDVALKSGFADQSHMSRCMRRFIGLTPGEVKRSVT
jgi:AraC family transcriptional regulator